MFISLHFIITILRSYCGHFYLTSVQYIVFFFVIFRVRYNFVRRRKLIPGKISKPFSKLDRNENNFRTKKWRGKFILYIYKYSFRNKIIWRYRLYDQCAALLLFYVCVHGSTNVLSVFLKIILFRTPFLVREIVWSGPSLIPLSRNGNNGVRAPQVLRHV